MSTGPAFWDASALIPLCIPQRASARAKVLVGRYSVAWWWATPVEIASGLARLLRMRQIDAREWQDGCDYADTLKAKAHTIRPSNELRDSAVEIITRYDLRAGDSLQLAAALAWCEGKPNGQVFLSLDQRLRDAALLCGFDAKTI